MQSSLTKFITKLIFTLLTITLPITLNTAWAQTAQAPNPLATPEIPSSALTGWAERAVLSTLSFDYKNYRAAQKTAATYFTPDAWKEYTKALEASGNLNAVKERKLNVIATATGPAQITAQGVDSGHYTWTIVLPVMVNYYEANSTTPAQSQNTDVNVIVVKTPSKVNPQGIAINSLVMKAKK